MNPLLSLRNVSAGYGQNVVLRHVDLDIGKHDFIGVIGPNGGGKTTLIKVILGLIEPLQGQVVWSGAVKGPRIGYLPQVSQFDKRFPITVSEIVLSGLMSATGRGYRYSAEEKQKAAQLIAQAGLAKLSHLTASELSGGQLQRALICRALISSPELLILDEPGNFVDNRFEQELYEQLGHLNEQMAILMVSHDVGTITAYVKTIACVNTYLHYHPSNIISEEQLAAYNCPLQILTHGDVPHTVLQTHSHAIEHNHKLHD